MVISKSYCDGANVPRKSNREKKEMMVYLIAILSVQCSPTGYNLGPFIAN